MTREVLRDFVFSQKLGKTQVFKDPSWNLTQCLKNTYGMSKEEMSSMVDFDARREERIESETACLFHTCITFIEKTDVLV